MSERSDVILSTAMDLVRSNSRSFTSFRMTGYNAYLWTVSPMPGAAKRHETEADFTGVT
ncbi:MAG: hypothetical protein GX115_16815 [Ruminiclostridium sp.]|nr:hypothetical protein [Ruminiclostridium sp.]